LPRAAAVAPVCRGVRGRRRFAEASAGGAGLPRRPRAAPVCRGARGDARARAGMPRRMRGCPGARGDAEATRGCRGARGDASANGGWGWGRIEIYAIVITRSLIYLLRTANSLSPRRFGASEQAGSVTLGDFLVYIDSFSPRVTVPVLSERPKPLSTLAKTRSPRQPNRNPSPAAVQPEQTTHRASRDEQP
jgi:hypothetical protein